jgi:hypothetical protein
MDGIGKIRSNFPAYAPRRLSFGPFDQAQQSVNLLIEETFEEHLRDGRSGK